MPSDAPSERAFDLAVLDIAGTTVEEHQAVYAAQDAVALGRVRHTHLLGSVADLPALF